MDRRTVFVVHGRNAAARDAMFAFLRAIDLHPLEWETVVAETKQASPYIGVVLRTGFEMAQAAVVLLTGEDEARLMAVFHADTDPDYEKRLTPQPRLNVLLEAGMALGMFEERTIIVELGQLRPVSDLEGRHTIRMNNTPEKRRDLIARLRSAGCAVVDTGDDWVTAGDFDAAIAGVTPGESPEAEGLPVSGELTAHEKDLLILMLYSGRSCLGTTAGPQGEHIETDQVALYDPEDPELAVSYALALQRLRTRGLLRWGSAGDRGIRYHLTDPGIAEAARLREEGHRFDTSQFPAPRARAW